MFEGPQRSLMCLPRKLTARESSCLCALSCIAGITGLWGIIMERWDFYQISPTWCADRKYGCHSLGLVSVAVGGEDQAINYLIKSLYQRFQVDFAYLVKWQRKKQRWTICKVIMSSLWVDWETQTPQSLQLGNPQYLLWAIQYRVINWDSSKLNTSINFHLTCKWVLPCRVPPRRLQWPGPGLDGPAGDQHQH